MLVRSTMTRLRGRSSSAIWSSTLAIAISVCSTVVGQTRRRITPECVPTGYIRASAKSSSNVITMARSSWARRKNRFVCCAAHANFTDVANTPFRLSPPQVIRDCGRHVSSRMRRLNPRRPVPHPHPWQRTPAPIPRLAGSTPGSSPPHGPPCSRPLPSPGYYGPKSVSRE